MSTPSSSTSGSSSRLSGRDIFDLTFSGSLDPPSLPLLKSDASPFLWRPPPRSLDDYRASETREQRERRLRALWRELPKTLEAVTAAAKNEETGAELTREEAEVLRRLYVKELMGRCDAHGRGKEVAGKEKEKADAAEVDWDSFVKYADAKEAELWTIFHDELDLDGNGHLDADELRYALAKAGIHLSSPTLSEFMASLTVSPHSHAVSFTEFRDFLLLMPRKASTKEIYRFWKVRKFMGDDGRGAARVTMEGDVSLSAEDRPPVAPPAPSIIMRPYSTSPASQVQVQQQHEHSADEEETESDAGWLGGASALKYLLAGGIAGAVSRSATAPFDRLKVYLITRSPDIPPVGKGMPGKEASARGGKILLSAVRGIWMEGGIGGFWIGNGLNVVKIFPESAIKFLSYESSKRLFAKHWDHVDDSREISSFSRFMSGGIGGITSQLSIYPIETLKTQMQSSTGGMDRALVPSIKRLWALGGMRAYYRGLVVGLVGVFPYSAIDMSTFEALKLAYIRSTGKDEPGVVALLLFGSVSGSVGATSVYPLNLLRTRLQASGSSGHPERYTGIMDVARKTMQREGWKGFYKGLTPTLAKVVPAVSISYVVYESTKRKLGV